MCSRWDEEQLPKQTNEKRSWVDRLDLRSRLTQFPVDRSRLMPGVKVSPLDIAYNTELQSGAKIFLLSFENDVRAFP